MTDILFVRLGGIDVGTLGQVRNTLRLTYDQAWQASPNAYPLSLSIPLVQPEHGDEVVRPWLEGLLPDSESVLRSWARRFSASARNPFSLLRHVGEDLPGAVQLIRPERMAAVAADQGSVQWLDEAQVADQLRGLVDDRSDWLMPGDTGHFSLAGAQPKTALLYENGRWGVPSGPIATTHVLKPPAMEGLDGLVENEHLCLGLAGALGIPAADSAAHRFGDQDCLIVKRYDRYRIGGTVTRIHQEDCCQALGVSPHAKYEAEGGPGTRSIIQLLRDHSSSPRTDVSTFVKAMALNWASGASDGHAKNYSVLIGAGNEVRLAPVYDILTVLPYPGRYHAPNVKLSMRIGGEYRLEWIRRRHWERFAEDASLDPADTVQLVQELVERIPAVVAEVCERARDEGLSNEFVMRFEDATRVAARRALEALA